VYGVGAAQGALVEGADVAKYAINKHGYVFAVEDDDPRGVFDDAGPVCREPTVVERAGQHIPPEGVGVGDLRKVATRGMVIVVRLGKPEVG